MRKVQDAHEELCSVTVYMVKCAFWCQSLTLFNIIHKIVRDRLSGIKYAPDNISRIILWIISKFPKKVTSQITTNVVLLQMVPRLLFFVSVRR